MRNIRNIRVDEISILFEGRPAVPAATVLMSKSDKEVQEKLTELYRELGSLRGLIEAKQRIREHQEEVRKVGRDLQEVVAELTSEISKLLDRPVRTHADIQLGANVNVSKADTVIRIAQLRREFDALWKTHLQGEGN